MSNVASTLLLVWTGLNMRSHHRELNGKGWLVVWHSGKTLVCDRRTFPVLRSTCGWRVTVTQLLHSYPICASCSDRHDVGQGNTALGCPKNGQNLLSFQILLHLNILRKAKSHKGRHKTGTASLSSWYHSRTQKRYGHKSPSWKLSCKS